MKQQSVLDEVYFLTGGRLGTVHNLPIGTSYFCIWASAADFDKRESCYN